jgi:methyltransferase (TIGR00027 family)
MTKKRRSKEEELDDVITAIPFTARLNAYFRAEESKMSAPLLIDPLAERLAGDMSEYFRKHKRVAGMGDSAIVRSWYIENELLAPWCFAHKKSQIVLLGAGLDTRAYRFSPLQKESHTVFEIDLPLIIRYKEKVLRGEEPLCSLVRVPADLSDSVWVSKLVESGFSIKTPSFWVLEGLVYYIDREAVIVLLQKLAEMSTSDSQLFVDVCVPALADLQWGPYTRHFKWGIAKDEVSSFFARTAWEVTSCFIDDYNHGRDVGQKGIIFVHGEKNVNGIEDNVTYLVKEGVLLSDFELRTFSIKLAKKMIPEIEAILKKYVRNPEEGLRVYLDFVKQTESGMRIIARAQKNAVFLGNISPRLLGDPMTIEANANQRTREEIESFIVGYLKAMLLLVYCGMLGLQGDQFRETSLYSESVQAQSASGMGSVHSIMEIVKRELNVSND